jgi:hypothetical protein
MYGLRTQNRELAPRGKYKLGKGVQAASDVHNPVMAHLQACRYPVWQGIIIREPGRANSIPPIKAKVWDLEAAISN